MGGEGEGGVVEEDWKGWVIGVVRFSVLWGEGWDERGKMKEEKCLGNGME